MHLLRVVCVLDHTEGNLLACHRVKHVLSKSSPFFLDVSGQGRITRCSSECDLKADVCS